MIAITKLLPRHLHVSAIGFAVALGGSGAAILPFVIGAQAQHHGVQVMSPIVLGTLVFLLLTWSFLPNFNRKHD